MLYPDYTKKDLPIEPLLDIDISIDNKDLSLSLEFHSEGDDPSVFSILDSWIDKFISVSTSMDRADTILNKLTDYMFEVTEDLSVRTWLAKIYKKVKQTEKETTKWKYSTFEDFLV
jgi:hypothetical protein